ncbi:MAG: HDOD domain-containing protein [Candidatus Scalindua sp. AMX11]|nr:MAG: HDOD domain-containing protein [Candidatus Scalindua sp.]NOG84447.1 HDOD domain-containing protein [Planctomycetota bacterium]RZV72438.1 MAG: HDOD domain-containing protein [Candidatus Scalindua sp. SCAELEC01]TDE64593.1 MAG: HDOD domain-containing protein [Candidatus Scalindua sp. AMX11]GJQ57537.1 MAG: signal transduction protein [Candidatus Scalindua sp.]
MIKILFVDDQPEILRGLRRALATVDNGWDFKFAPSGEEALNMMSESSFDVVISDMRMPKMDGVELLNVVMIRYPDTVRIILSGSSERERIMESVKCAHQFLIKPCNMETMFSIIERACKHQDLFTNKTLKRLVAGAEKLPSPPQLYNSIVSEMQSEDVSIKKVGQIISQDISMSAKILQIVNSAFFGLPQKIIDPQQASVYLGLDTLKALVLSIHVFSSCNKNSELLGCSPEDLQKHSIMVGTLAKDIARVQRADAKVAEESLIAGIFHDIGKLILLNMAEECKKIIDYIEMTRCNLLEAEYAVLKTSHAELGAYLLGVWGIPDNVVEAVAFHHNPSKLHDEVFMMQKESSNKDIWKLNIDDKDTTRETNHESLKGFTALTAVHVAHALIMQQGGPPPSTPDFSNVDMGYLERLNLADKLPEWAECCNKIKGKEE